VIDSEQAQRERASGAFALVVDSTPADEASWKALRRALGFSRADGWWLRDRIPGVVRRGVQADLEVVAARVRDAGFLARVMPKAAAR
jgi:hypothetical protein